VANLSPTSILKCPIAASLAKLGKNSPLLFLTLPGKTKGLIYLEQPPSGNFPARYSEEEED